MSSTDTTPLHSDGDPPPLFASVPTRLFTVLGGPLAPVYWATLARFYRYEYEEATTALVKPAAIELTESVVQASPQWRNSELGVLDSLDADGVEPILGPPTADDSDDQRLQAMARRIVQRLEESGWYHFEYQARYGEVLNFFPYAARILDTLIRLARDEQPVLQSYAIGIAQALRSDLVASRPGYAIHEARAKTAEFTRELKVLNRNIFIATRRLVEEAQTAAGVLEELLDRYQRRVMGNFHRLKTVDNPFRHRGDILRQLDALEGDATLLDKAATWYSEQLNLDRATAATTVHEALFTIRSQIERLPTIVSEIDARNSRFSGSARNRLVYLLSKNRHIDGQLQGLIDALAKGDIETLPFELYRARFLGEDFLYVPRERTSPVQSTPLGAPVAIDEARMRERALQLLAHPYGRRAIGNLVHALLGERKQMLSTEIPLTNDDDYVRFICVVMHGTGPRRGAYTFSPMPCNAGPCPGAICQLCHVSSGLYRVPKGTIERSTRRRHG